MPTFTLANEVLNISSARESGAYLPFEQFKQGPTITSGTSSMSVYLSISSYIMYI